MGGSAGTAGASGSTGGGGRSGDARPDCATPGVIHTAPTVPSAIAAPAGVALVGGYYASGEQIYTCTPSPASDAGSDGGDAAAPSGTWVNTAVATLSGDNCSVAAQHSYTTGPTWVATPDGSTVVGARVNAVPAPVADGGDGGATAIPWLLLRAASNTGEGIFANVTYIHRLDTVGGEDLDRVDLVASGACEPGDASPPVRSPYTATYYFYTGGNSEAGTTSDASDASTTTDSGGGD